MAIRSARMAAMRDLAEQIHGLQVDSSTTVIDLIVQNDTFRGMVKKVSFWTIKSITVVLSLLAIHEFGY